MYFIYLFTKSLHVLWKMNKEEKHTMTNNTNNRSCVLHSSHFCENNHKTDFIENGRVSVVHGIVSS